MLDKSISKIKAIELLTQGKVIKIVNSKNKLYSYYIMDDTCTVFDLKKEESYSIDEFDDNVNKFYC